ncbi:glutamate racemase [Candidatus Uhrbacteria bacterium]|nr:glutamate racemase [Candidatus Uhrbacteria bacterium]
MIGFFDSGVGGLTIIEEVHRRLPSYGTVYLGDSARMPYGEKRHDELVQFLWEGAQWLFARGCSLIIVACNSASASALREVQQTKLSSFPGRRILGVIRPTVEELSHQGYKRILVLSTTATKKSEAYVHEFAKINPSIQVISHACPNWGPMVEEGKAVSIEMKIEVNRELSLVDDPSAIDAVLLACTHYPYVREDVEAFFLYKIPVFNQGNLVASSLEDYLLRHPEMERTLTKDGAREYFTTGDVANADFLASKRFGYDVRFQNTFV